MKQRINSPLLKEWARLNGGIAAENRIREITGVALTTLQKMLEGSYPHCPGFAARKALVKLTGISEDELFPIREIEESAS